MKVYDFIVKKDGEGGSIFFKHNGQYFLYTDYSCENLKEAILRVMKEYRITEDCLFTITVKNIRGEEE